MNDKAIIAIISLFSAVAGASIQACVSYFSSRRTNRSGETKLALDYLSARIVQFENIKKHCIELSRTPNDLIASQDDKAGKVAAGAIVSLENSKAVIEEHGHMFPDDVNAALCALIAEVESHRRDVVRGNGVREQAIDPIALSYEISTKLLNNLDRLLKDDVNLANKLIKKLSN